MKKIFTVAGCLFVLVFVGLLTFGVSENANAVEIAKDDSYKTDFENYVQPYGNGCEDICSWCMHGCDYALNCC